MTVHGPAKTEPALKNVLTSMLIAMMFLAFPVATTAPAEAADLLKMPAPKIPGQMAVHMNFLDITVCGNRYVAVGEYGLILYSDNNGISWHQADVPTSVTLTAVDFPMGNQGWAVGHDGVILHSGNRGESWQIQISGIEANKRVLAQIEEQIAEVTAEMETASEEEMPDLEYLLEDITLYHSDMSVPVRDNVPTTLLNVMFLDNQVGFVMGAFGMIMKTQNGGKDWNPIVKRMYNFNGHHYYGMERFMDDGQEVLVLAGEYGTLMHSFDRGASWQRLPSPHEGSYFGVIASENAQTLLLYGLGGKAFLTDGLSKPWVQVDIPDNLSVSGAATISDGGFLLTTVSGKLFRIQKNGTAAHTIPRQVQGSITAVETVDHEVLLAGIMGLRKIKVTDRKDD